MSTSLAFSRGLDLDPLRSLQSFIFGGEKIDTIILYPENLASFDRGNNGHLTVREILSPTFLELWSEVYKERLGGRVVETLPDGAFPELFLQMREKRFLIAASKPIHDGSQVKSMPFLHALWQKTVGGEWYLGKWIFLPSLLVVPYTPYLYRLR